MKHYIIRHLGNTLTISEMNLSTTDNMAIPSDASVLTESGWAVLGALCGASDQDGILARLSDVCTQLGLTLDNQIQSTT